MTKTKNALLQMDAAQKQMYEMNEKMIRAAVLKYGAENVSVVHDGIEIRIPKLGLAGKGTGR